MSTMPLSMSVIGWDQVVFISDHNFLIEEVVSYPLIELFLVFFRIREIIGCKEGSINIGSKLKLLRFY